MFWNGTRWVDQRPRPPAPEPRRLRDWFATAVMIIGVIALSLPFMPALSGVQRVELDPPTGEAGQRVLVTGVGFGARTDVQILWDGSSTGMPTTTTTGRGALKVRLIVPSGAAAGVHVVTAQVGLSTRLAATTFASVETTFVVTTSETAPTAPVTPSLAPTGAPPPTTAPTAGPTVGPAPTTNPTTSPTQAPTAAPTAAPTPPPIPAPTPAPTPTPGPTAVGCNATLGVAAGDRTAALQAMIDGAPNGAMLCIASGTHTVNGNLRFFNRTGLTFVGPATIVTSTTNRGNLSLFEPIDSSSITFRDLVLDGGRPDPGKYWPSHEFEFAVDFRSSSGTVDRVTMLNWGGDAVYVGYAALSGSSYSHDVVVTNSIINGTGRMGIAVTAGTNVTITGNSIDRVALTAIDLEPDYAYHGAHGILVAGNTIKRYGLDPHLSPWFFQADVDAGSYSNITIRDNVFVGSALTTRIGKFSSVRRTNIVITGNRSDTAGYPPLGGSEPLMYLWHIDGLTVLNNVQPVAAGTLMSIVDSTGVTIN